MSEVFENSIFQIEAKTKGFEDALAQVEKLSEMKDSIKINASIKGFSPGNIKKIEQFEAALGRLRKKTGGRDYTINVTVNLRGLTENRINMLAQVAPILGQIRKQIGSKPLIVQIDVRGAQKATTALRGLSSQAAMTKTQVTREMQVLEGSIARITSRIGFLVTALGANYAYDIVFNSLAESAKATGAVRGMELTYTRAGLAGQQYLSILREQNSELDHFQFQVGNATDMLNKLAIGGLRPTVDEMQRMKSMSVGAGVLFGESPSKLGQDLGTAALRTSYRMADNLGLIVRPKDAYAEYAAGIGKDPLDLTGEEKVEAFYRKMIDNAGADMLVLASQIETPFITLSNATTKAQDLKLAFGDVIAEGLMPFLKVLNEVNDETLETIARLTILGAKVAALMGAIQLGKGGMGMLRSATSAIPEAMALQAQQRAGNISLTKLGQEKVDAGRAQMRGIAGGFLSAALIAGGVAALDNYNKRMAQAAELQTDLVQGGIQLAQHLNALGIEAGGAGEKINQLKDRLESSGLGKEQTAKVLEMNAAMEAYSSELDTNMKALDAEAQAGSEWQGKLQDLKDAQADFNDRVVEATEQGTDFGKNMEVLSAIANDEYVPAVINATRAIQDHQMAEAQALAEGQTNWDKFANGVVTVGAIIADSLANAVMFVSNAVYALVTASASATVAIFQTALGQAARFTNKVIDTLNQGISMMNLVPGVGISLIPKIEGAPSGSFSENFSNNFDWAGGDKAWENIKGLYTGGDFGGFGFYDGIMERKAKLGTDSLSAAIQTEQKLKDLQAKGFDLGGALGGGGKGKGGGGSKTKKTPAEYFADAEAKYLESLKKIQLEMDQQLMLAGELTNEQKAQFESSRINATLGFSIQAELEGWQEFIAKSAEFQNNIATVQEDYANVQLLEKKAKADKIIEGLREELSEIDRVNETQRRYGLEVDETKKEQAYISGLMNLMSAQIDEAQRQDVFEEFPQLKDAITRMRQDAERIRIDDAFQHMLRGLDFQSALALAREPDSNRDAVLTYNSTINSLVSTLQHAEEMVQKGFIQPGDADAIELADQLRTMAISMEEQITSIRDGEFLTSKEDKERMANASAQLSTRVQQLSGELDPAPASLSTMKESMGTLVTELDDLSRGTDTNGKSFLQGLAYAGQALANLPALALGMLQGQPALGIPNLGGGGAATASLGFTPSGVSIPSLMQSMRLYEQVEECPGGD